MTTPTSPKVIAAVIAGILVSAVVSNISALTPDMFDFLGPWKLFAFGIFTTALMGLAAWWKTDPLRLNAKDEAPKPPAGGGLVAAVEAPALPAPPAVRAPAIFPSAALNAPDKSPVATPGAEPIAQAS